MEITIRELKKEEKPLLKKYYKKIIDDKTLDEKTIIDKFNVKGVDYAIVAEYDNKIIGLAWAVNNYDSNDYYIYSNNFPKYAYIYVEEKYRNELVGTKLAYKLFYDLLIRDVVKLNYIEKINQTSLSFLSKIGFNHKIEIGYDGNIYDYYSLSLYNFFKNQIKLYSLEYNRYKCLCSLPYIYNDEEISEIIAILLCKKVIREDQLRFERYNGVIDSNETLQNTKRNYIREELLRRKVEKARMIIEEAKKLNASDLMNFNASDLLKIREEIIRKKEEKYNKSNISASYGGSSNNKARAKRFEKYEKDKDFEKKILEEARKAMVYTNEVFELIENYMRLYSLTHTDFMERSGISRKTYSKIKLDKTNPDKKPLCKYVLDLV